MIVNCGGDGGFQFQVKYTKNIQGVSPKTKCLNAIICGNVENKYRARYVKKALLVGCYFSAFSAGGHYVANISKVAHWSDMCFALGGNASPTSRGFTPTEFHALPCEAHSLTVG